MDDDFLNSDDLPPSLSFDSPPRAATSSSSSSSTSAAAVSASKALELSLDDELESIFSLSPSSERKPPPASSSSSTSNSTTAAAAPAFSKMDNDDFMAWLEDASPAPAPSSSTSSSSSSSAAASLSASLSASLAASTVSIPSVNPAASINFSAGAMESLIDELFDSPTASAILSPSAAHLAPSSSSSTSSSYFNSSVTNSAATSATTPAASNASSPSSSSGPTSMLTASLRDISAEIRAALQSNFVDSYSLRELVVEAGAVPARDRTKVWNVLINGLVTEDLEANSFRAAEKELASYPGLSDDISNMLQSFESKPACADSLSSAVELSSLKAELLDILVLYMMRKGIKQANNLAPFAAAVLYSARVSGAPRALASSCFYSFTSSYLPLSQLTAPAAGIALDTLRSYLRLLVCYHHPALGLHLDQLGALLGSSFTGNRAVTEASASGSSGNTPEQDKRVLGCAASEEWLLGSFLSVLPLELGCMVMDWIVFNEERFAGLYLTAALLHVFADYLVDKSSSKIANWTESIGRCDFSWVKISNGATSPTKARFAIDRVSDLRVFVVGWLHAATALREKTPAAFKKALSSLDSWAKSTAAKLSNGEETPSSRAAAYIIDNDGSDDDLDVKTPSAKTVDPELEKNRLLSTFRGASVFFSPESKLTSNESGNAKEFIQDYEREGVSLCLWSDASEAVPCMAARKKRQEPPKDVLFYFLAAVTFAMDKRSHEYSYLLQSSKITSELPFFFGIDCRSEMEKSLGLFPKSYSLDPSLLSDSDKVAKLLETLEPLSSSVHLCVFGAGEDYLRWELKNRSSKLSQIVRAIGNSQQEDTYESLWCEERSKLNSVAMFLMKKSFRQVSILEGGFSAAARYLYNLQSSSSNSNGLSGSLVEADLPSIYAILGVSDTMSSTRLVGTSVDANSSSFSSYSQAASSFIAPFIDSSSKATSSSSANGTSSNNDSPASTAKISSYMSSWASATSSFLKSSVNNFSQPESNTSTSNANTGASATAGGRYSELVAPENIEKGKAAIAEVGKRLSIFGSASLESIKRGISQVGTNKPTENNEEAPQSAMQSLAHVRSSNDASKLDKNATAFVIDDDDSDGEGQRQHGEDDSTRISVRRSEVEKQQALVLHKLAGLRKGDEVSINREFLPGAVLFPCMKLKQVPAKTSEETPISNPEVSVDAAAANVDGSSATSEAIEQKPQEPATTPAEPEFVLVHRYLVVTKERFMVLDARGGGVGSKAIVKSNHHLTELIKMTFRKRDPELVTMFFLHNGGANKTHQYRVPKKQQFVEILQRNMQKYKE